MSDRESIELVDGKELIRLRLLRRDKVLRVGNACEIYRRMRLRRDSDFELRLEQLWVIKT